MNSSQAYLDEQFLRTTLHGMMYGFLLLAALLNVQCWRTTRNSLYAYFVLFLVLVFFGMVSVNVPLYGAAPLGVMEHIGIFQKIFFIGIFASAFLFTTHLFPTTMQLVRHRRELHILFISIIVLLIALGFWDAYSSLFWFLLYFLFLIYTSVSLGLTFYSFSRRNDWYHGLLICAYLILSISQWFFFEIAFKSLQVGVFDLAWWQFALFLHLAIMQMVLFIDVQKKTLSKCNLQNQALSTSGKSDGEDVPDHDLRRVIERMIHEFKTPLAVIDSSVQSLSMLDHANSAEHSERYQRISRAVSRMNDLLMHSLNTSSSMLTSSTESIRQFDFPSLMEASIADFAAYDFTSNKEILVRLDPYKQELVHCFQLRWMGIDHPQSMRLEGDFELLQAALSHVFKKAFTHTAMNAEVSVTLRKLGFSSGFEMVEISILKGPEGTKCDSQSQQMSVSELQNLQPNSNDSAADLHLTIARQVIEKHGGMLNTQLKHSDCIVLQIQLPLLS